MKTAPYLLVTLACLIAALAQTPATQPPAPQKKTAAPPKVIDTGVSTNPRSGKEDPRVGLKGGLYDAGEAAFGMERLASLPKPSGWRLHLRGDGAECNRELEHHARPHFFRYTSGVVADMDL